jgi:hypothetical protein
MFMLLHNKEIDSLVEINDLKALINPAEGAVVAQSQSGEEEQDPEPMQKQNLIFPSGENLPRCWVDASYKNA